MKKIKNEIHKMFTNFHCTGSPNEYAKIINEAVGFNERIKIIKNIYRPVGMEGNYMNYIEQGIYDKVNTDD